MTELHAGCDNCAREGYDECLCSFCTQCGNFGHSRDNCTRVMCLWCNERHAVNECPLNEYGHIPVVSQLQTTFVFELRDNSCLTTSEPITQVCYP
jgi:hypothetical protein